MSHLINFDDNLTISRNSGSIYNRSIIFIGLSGSGKSSMIKYLMNKSDTKIKSEISFSNVTSNFCVCNPFKYLLENTISYSDQEYDYKIEGENEFLIQCYDTIGIGDPDNDVKKIIESIRYGIIKKITRINQIFIVVKLDRLRMGFSDSLIELINHFEEWGCNKENFTLIISFTDFLRREKKQDFALEVLKKLELENKIKEIIFVSLPNIEEIDSKWHSMFEEIKINGYKSLIRSILFSEKSVNPRSYIMDQIREEIDENVEIIKSKKKESNDLVREIEEIENDSIPIISSLKNFFNKELREKKQKIEDIKKEIKELETINLEKESELKTKIIDNEEESILIEEKQNCVKKTKKN